MLGCYAGRHENETNLSDVRGRAAAVGEGRSALQLCPGAGALDEARQIAILPHRHESHGRG